MVLPDPHAHVLLARPLEPAAARAPAALARLGAKERAALLLYEVAGFSVDEIATIQGDRSASAVKSRLSQARTRARGHLVTPSAA